MAPRNASDRAAVEVVREEGGHYEETLTRIVVELDGRWRYLPGDEYVQDLEAGACPVDRKPLADR